MILSGINVIYQTVVCNMKNVLIVIIGPTAIGKTALSIQLAQHFNCEIISCDSRQFYKEMTIGTAVPEEEELNAVQHHCIQNKSILDKYTVGDFEKEALEILDSLFEKNPIQIMVGGSGLYVDAVLKGFDSFPEIDPTIRETINVAYEGQGISYLQKELYQLDQEYYHFLEQTNSQTLQNPQRMKRFVEVSLGTGKPYSSFLGKRKYSRNFETVLIGLEAERAVIYDRINQRVELMFANGLVEEVTALVPYKNLNALQTVGYRELFSYLENEITLETAKEEIQKNTRRFAKRQVTWFQRLENVNWFDYKTDTNTILENINKEIASKQKNA